MKLIRNFFIFIWRIWFYTLLVLPILLMFPLLIVSIAKESWYPYYFKLARVWAQIILYGMGFMPKVKRLEETQKGKSYMYVANHTSIVDIMLMLHAVRNPFVFVGKKELAKFPIFGFFYKRTCILVDRGDPKSRMAVFESAQKKLRRGLSICIFPEGGIPDDRNLVLDTFKDGAFRLALEHQVPVVPLVFYDNKKRFSYDFFSGSPGQMRVKVLPFIPTAGRDTSERRELRAETFNVIYEELLADKK
ncbi:MAG: lysophospholipid acyltransferase family protein [Leeuwenhoekiella sp.]